MPSERLFEDLRHLIVSVRVGAFCFCFLPTPPGGFSPGVIYTYIVSTTHRKHSLPRGCLRQCSSRCFLRATHIFLPCLLPFPSDARCAPLNTGGHATHLDKAGDHAHPPAARPRPSPAAERSRRSSRERARRGGVEATTAAARGDGRPCRWRGWVSCCWNINVCLAVCRWAVCRWAGEKGRPGMDGKMVDQCNNILQQHGR